MHVTPFAPRTRTGLAVCAVLTLLTTAPMPAATRQNTGAWPEAWKSDSAFEALWTRTDAPVATGQAARSWLWGPEPFAVANEPYAGSPTGLRLVEYVDKGRMELNDPSADRESPWFVTSGLLVREMVLGQIQVGAADFRGSEPAQVPVTGDAGSFGAPSYAAFAGKLQRVPDRRGRIVGDLMSSSGEVSQATPQGDPNLFTASEYDEVTGHNIPSVFVDWARRPGPVYESGALVNGPLMDRLFLLGRPLTEPYWVDATIGGTASRVLVQLFERRTLTYNPGNPPEWRVEMGNVGRAYFQWRYGSSPPGPAVAGRSGASGLTVAGWNWPAGLSTSVHVDLAGGDTPLSGPVGAAADLSGRFSVMLPPTAALTGAIAARANLRLVAEGAGGMVALPFSAAPAENMCVLAGMVSQFERDGAVLRLTLTALDGAQRRLVVPPGAQVRYAEGSLASAGVVDVGIYAAAQGSEENGTLQVAQLDLLSVSRTGAVVGYQWAGDNLLRVSGRGWPSGQEVAFGTGSATGNHAQFATLKSDSRGNLTGSVAVTGMIRQNGTGTWLSARTASGSAGASVSVPLAAQGSGAAPPLPRVFVYAGSGAQSAAAPAGCPAAGCPSNRSVALPVAALSITPGEVLRLRALSSGDPFSGPVPAKDTADLYPAGAEGAGEFVPSGAPVHSSGEVPGRPLSVSLPQALAPGRYVLLLHTAWPGVRDTLVYGFVLIVR